ncbi:MAG TPA: GDYXXLXY domain-containing protein [Pusillimonas sp.]|uniref:GDYXXLXY domain-containing protein n=1 Tax=Pusillimonas sp. TaxID=3040095 RepID=UPI002BF4DAF5|nr:GDYXXLXY domain-containing protein [Pusillimonas sp.]HUH88001.1 GDYXXLXY domain-containing protein [Pusillimonas sp.]
MIEQVRGKAQGEGKQADARLLFVYRCAVSIACLLLAGSGVFWVAANWADASKPAKLAGAQLVLAALVLAAWLIRPRDKASWRNKGSANHNFSVRSNLAGLAAVAVGALLALVGQIYQTGADAWQLFLTWALLLLPWLVTLHTVFIGLLFAAVLNTALCLYIGVHSGGIWFGWGTWTSSALVAALLNVVLLTLYEVFARFFNDPWRIAARALATAIAGWLVAAALGAIDTGAGPIGMSLIGWLVLAAIYLVYTRLRSDLVIVSLAAVAAFILLVVPLLHWVGSEAGLLVAVLVLLAAMAFGLRKLGKLLRARAVHGEPWYISVFRLVAMGITAVLLMAFLLMVLDFEVEFLWVPGLVVCLVGVILYRSSGSEVVRELGLTLMTAGLLLAGGSFFMLYDEGALLAIYALLVLGLGLYVLAGNAAFRFIAAFFVLGMATLMTWPVQTGDGTLLGTEHALRGVSLPLYLRVWWFSVAGTLALLWGRGELAGKRWRPLGWALVFLAQIVVWQTPAPPLGALLKVWHNDPSVVVIWLACAAMPVLAVAALLWRRPALPLMTRLGVPTAFSVGSVGWMGAPGVSLALLWLVLGQAMKHRSLQAFGVLALMAYLMRYYYLLDSSLLYKSSLLAATGVWLLVCAWLFRRAGGLRGSTETQPDSEAAPRVASHEAPVARHATPGAGKAFGLLAGLFLVLLVVNTGIYQREQVLNQGRPIVLQLAPVDPRSLMQGDYMRLNFQVADQVYGTLEHAPEASRRTIETQREGLLVLRPDSAGVHRLLAVVPSSFASVKDQVDAHEPNSMIGVEPKESDVLLEFRLRHGGVRVVTDAWFFPEGQADHFAQARYGQLRVDGNGVGLLVNVLDSAMHPLAQR